MTFIAFLNNQSTNNIKIQKKKQTKLNLFETYNAILELFKNQYIRQLIFILFTCHIGHGATYFMTSLILLE
jgi:hypothetical protein